MTIEKASISDIGNLKELAKSAILESVDADIDIKKEIITDRLPEHKRVQISIQCN